MTKLFDKLMTQARDKGVAEHKVLAKYVMGYHRGDVYAYGDEHLIQWRLVLKGDSNIVYLYHYGTLIFYYNNQKQEFYYYGEGPTDTRYINLIADYCGLDIHFRTKLDEGTYIDYGYSKQDDCVKLMDYEQAKQLQHFIME